LAFKILEVAASGAFVGPRDDGDGDQVAILFQPLHYAAELAPQFDHRPTVFARIVDDGLELGDRGDQKQGSTHRHEHFHQGEAAATVRADNL
jgi:hypothetical protein